MKKIYDYILLGFGAFIIGYSDHFESLFESSIVSLIGLVLVIYGAQHIAIKSLYNRINALMFSGKIQNKYIEALESGLDVYNFLLTTDELQENKSYIDWYRKKHGSIVNKIEYELDSNSNYYACKFVKAYDMKDKEWIDEQYKTIHLFKNIGLLEFFQDAFIHTREIPIKFNNKKYLCQVTSLIITDEMDENNDKMIEIDLNIINKLDE